MAATVQGIFLSGDHASRPAASSPPVGSVYSCSDHDLVYQTDGSTWATWLTAGAGGAMTNPMTTAGDIIYGGASGTPTRLGVGTATQVLAVNSGATAPEWVDAASGGSSVQQLYAYPQHADLSGDSDHFTSDNTTKWTNQDTTFDTRDVVGGSFQRLGITGASQTSTIRQVLGTPLTGAFDVRTLIHPDIHVHSSADVSVGFKGLNSAGSRVFEMRLTAHINSGGTTINIVQLDCFGNGDANEIQQAWYEGQSVTLRVTRDGSNNLQFFHGLGSTPMVLNTAIDSSRIPISLSQTGTVDWIEYTMIVPAGPNASSQRWLYIDYFQVA